jgi:hypothetical protein
MLFPVESIMSASAPAAKERAGAQPAESRLVEAVMFLGIRKTAKSSAGFPDTTIMIGLISAVRFEAMMAFA